MIIPSSLYIHFPYCLYKCHYCDFNSYATPVEALPSKKYLAALILEIQKWVQLYESSGGLLGAPVSTKLDTIFIGGGTPSLLTPAEVEQLLHAVDLVWPIQNSAEITLEANPGTLTLEKLLGFKQAGINRVSVGVQSFQEKYLKPMGRIHSGEDARQALGWVAQTGFISWSADLMYGFPQQGLHEWQSDVEELLRFQPPHLSCYAFTVEAGAPYARWVREGRAERPSDDEQTMMDDWNLTRFKQSGYSAYEISNFCRGSNYSRHNLVYWEYQPFIAVGAGATGFYQGHPELFGQRTQNHKLPNQYLKAINEGKSWFETEAIPFKTAMQEFMMMGLRLNRGISTTQFEALFGKNIDEVFGEPARALVRKGWFEMNAHWRVSEIGRQWTNQVIAEFW